jgi:MoaA/NifB/PqqE/SkfB family radical SAM enzyme
MNEPSATGRRFPWGNEVRGALTRCKDLVKVGGYARVVPSLLRNRFSGGRPRPVFLSHMVTNRCNGNCPYCFWNRPGGEEMGLAEIRRLYREARGEGFVFNNIWGGEPLLREDLPQVVMASRASSLLTTVVTNGHFLEERHEFCAHTDVLVVSLDAPGELHDRIRGIDGLFKRAVRGMDLVREKYPRLHLNICCVLSTLNRGRVAEMIRLSKALGASIFFCPVGDNASIAEWPHRERVAGLMKPMEEIMGDFRVIREHKERGDPVESSFHLIDYFMQGKRKPYRCRRPRVYLNVYADGSVETCFLGIFANARKTPLHDVLRMPGYQRAARMSRDCAHACNANDAIEISGLWDFRPGSLRNWL